MSKSGDIFSTYRSLEEEGILVSFKGIITKDLLNSLCQVIDEKMGSRNEEPKIRKKVYNVLVEILQNVYHHVDRMPSETESDTLYHRDSMFVLKLVAPGVYELHTGNLILNSETEKLRERIEFVNNLSADELREHYVESLSNSELSEKGGAGLGIIDISRKSGNKLVYQFDKMTENYSFFSLIIKIGKTENQTQP